MCRRGARECPTALPGGGGLGSTRGQRQELQPGEPVPAHCFFPRKCFLSGQWLLHTLPEILIQLPAFLSLQLIYKEKR